MVFIPVAWLLASLLEGEIGLAEEGRGLFTLTLLCFTFGLFFALIQIARALNAAEGKGSEKFNEYSGTFLTLWLLPFSSFWYLQKNAREIFLGMTAGAGEEDS